MQELTFEVSFETKRKLKFWITSSASTFGTLITQSAYLWDLNPEDVYYLQAEGEEGIFLNDSPIFPYLASGKEKISLSLHKGEGKTLRQM